VYGTYGEEDNCIQGFGGGSLKDNINPLNTELNPICQYYK